MPVKTLATIMVTCCYRPELAKISKRFFKMRTERKNGRHVMKEEQQRLKDLIRKKQPRKATRSKPPSAKQLELLDNSMNSVVEGFELSEQAAQFAERAKSQVTAYPQIPYRKLPRWFLSLNARRAGIEELLEVTIKRALRAPSKKNLELAWLIANEIGRSPQGGTLIGRKINQELINQFHTKGV